LVISATRSPCAPLTTRLAPSIGQVAPAVTTVRRAAEEVAAASGGLLIRINPREPTACHAPWGEQPLRHVDLPVGALEGIRAIDSRLPPV
jgi:hypothetical protein